MVIPIYFVCFRGDPILSSQIPRPLRMPGKTETNIASSVLGFDRELAIIDASAWPAGLRAEIKNLITWGEFNVRDCEPESLFRVLERAAIFDIIEKLTKLGLGRSSINDLKMQYECIWGRLFDLEFGAIELAYPTSLYMGVIKTYVNTNCRSLDEQLPTLIRFHVEYYRKLHTYMEEKWMRQIDENLLN